MALVWIKQVVNSSKDKYLKLRQTDPSKHPVIHTASEFWRLDGDGTPTASRADTIRADLQIREGEWFGLGPGGELKCDWFVIPWSNTDRWVTAVASTDVKQKLLPTDGLQFQITPGAGGKSDYLQFSKRDLSLFAVPFYVGEAGFIDSTEGRLVLNDEGFSYQITASHSTGSDAGELFKTWAPILLAAILTGSPAPAA